MRKKVQSGVSQVLSNMDVERRKGHVSAMSHFLEHKVTKQPERTLKYR